MGLNGGHKLPGVGLFGASARTEWLTEGFGPAVGLHLAALGGLEAKALAERLGLPYAETPEALAAMPGVEALELAMPIADAEALLALAAKYKKHLALHYPPAATKQEAERLAETARRAGITALGMDLAAEHPFLAKAKILMDEERLGEVQAVRLKCQFGVRDPDAELRKRFLSDIGILERLMGPIREVFAYPGPDCRMLSYKFAGASRYGVHEMIVSRNLKNSDETEVMDHTLEITGTDGILWVRNLASCLVEAPKLMLKRKDQTTTWDDRADCDLAGLAKACRKRFAQNLRDHTSCVASLTVERRAWTLLDASLRAERESRPVAVT